MTSKQCEHALSIEVILSKNGKLEWTGSDAMATLLAAVEGGSLSAASRKLGMPLATVSRKVSGLEAHSEQSSSTGRAGALTLTDAGRSYAAAGKRILEDVEEAERAATESSARREGPHNQRMHRLTARCACRIGQVFLLHFIELRFGRIYIANADQHRRRY